MRKRISYTIENASRFFHIFDKLIDQIKNNDVNIGLSVDTFALGISPDTFIQRITDGLKFLVDKYPHIDPTLRPAHAYADYCALKGLIKKRVDYETGKVYVFVNIRMGLAPVEVSFVPEKAELIGVNTETSSRLFRNKVTEFLTSPELATQFTDLPIPSQDDVTWIQGMALEHNWTIAWKNDKKELTIIK